MSELKLKSEHIHCDGCAASVNRALSAIEGVQEVRVDVPTRTVFVKFDSPADESAIMNAMDEAGFGVAEELS